MRIVNKESIGLIIDLQMRLLPHMFRSEELIERCGVLLKGLGLLDIPTIYTEQYPKGLGTTDVRISNFFVSEKPIEKITFSCCNEAAVMAHLQSVGKKTVLIAGIEAHVCVLQTVLDLCDAGFNPVVVEDCIASRSENDKRVACNRILAAGICITTVESVLFELMGTAQHSAFKEISKLVK